MLFLTVLSFNDIVLCRFLEEELTSNVNFVVTDSNWKSEFDKVCVGLVNL